MTAVLPLIASSANMLISLHCFVLALTSGQKRNEKLCLVAFHR